MEYPIKEKLHPDYFFESYLIIEYVNNTKNPFKVLDNFEINLDLMPGLYDKIYEFKGLCIDSILTEGVFIPKSKEEYTDIIGTGVRIWRNGTRITKMLDFQVNVVYQKKDPVYQKQTMKISVITPDMLIIDELNIFDTKK